MKPVEDIISLIEGVGVKGSSVEHIQGWATGVSPSQETNSKATSTQEEKEREREKEKNLNCEDILIFEPLYNSRN